MRALVQDRYFANEICFETGPVYCLHAENFVVNGDFEYLAVEFFQPRNWIGKCRYLRKRVLYGSREGEFQATILSCWRGRKTPLTVCPSILMISDASCCDRDV